MAAFAGQGMSLSGDQLQPEVHTLLDWLQGDADVNLRDMPHHRAETLRRMKAEFLAHWQPTREKTP